MVLGLAVVVWMFIRDAEKENLREIIGSIELTPWLTGWILLTLVCVAGRETGLAWRFRILTDKDLGWWQSLKVTFLCEFTSCITPSAVGGSSMAMVFMNAEGIEFGRATALMLSTLLLDELFFVVACPFFVFLTPVGELFGVESGMFEYGLQLTFWIVYAVIAAWTALLFVGVLIKPQWVVFLLRNLFSLRVLRRWQSKVLSFCDNMVSTGHALRRRPISFWLKGFCATSLTWISRFLIVNALFMAFLPEQIAEQWLILARQFVVWLVLMVCPTPGGSGISEWLFTEFYGSFIASAGFALILAVSWRIVTFYIYLLVGATIVPKWFRDIYSRINKKKSL